MVLRIALSFRCILKREQQYLIRIEGDWDLTAARRWVVRGWVGGRVGRKVIPRLPPSSDPLARPVIVIWDYLHPSGIFDTPLLLGHIFRIIRAEDNALSFMELLLRLIS